MPSRKIKLKKPYSVILDYGVFELKLSSDSMLCGLIEEVNVVVKDEKVYDRLKSNNLIKEELDK